MSECLEYIFCCFNWSNRETQRGDRNNVTNHHKKNKGQIPKPKPSRIVSKYKPQETIQVQKQQRKKGKVVYTCPICTLYFNKILACNQCENNMCRCCVQSYEKKFELSANYNMKCPFCNSQKSNFIDYELQAKSYFDTTGKNGFLDPMERKKIDDQMKWNNSKSLHQNDDNNRSRQLYRIEEDEVNQNVIPTQHNIGLVQQYIEVQVRRNQSNIQQQQSIANLRNSNVEQNHHRPEMHATF